LCGRVGFQIPRFPDYRKGELKAKMARVQHINGRVLDYIIDHGRDVIVQGKDGFPHIIFEKSDLEELKIVIEQALKLIEEE